MSNRQGLDGATNRNHIEAHMADETTTPEADLPYPIQYRRSSIHRHVNADGVWVGSNGYNRIILNFWNETAALPILINAKTGPDGRKVLPGANVEFEAERGAIRTFDYSVGVSLPAAKDLVETLKTFIKFIEERDKPKAS